MLAFSCSGGARVSGAGSWARRLGVQIRALKIFFASMRAARAASPSHFETSPNICTHEKADNDMRVGFHMNIRKDLYSAALLPVAISKWA